MPDLKYIKKKVKVVNPEGFEASMNTRLRLRNPIMDKKEYDFRIKRLKSIDYIQIWDLPLEENRLVKSADVYNFNDEYLFTLIDIDAEPYKSHFEIIEEE